MLQEWLVAQGLQQSGSDSCLYVLPGKLWVAFWVDDFVVMGSTRQLVNQFKAAISARFKMRDLGSLQHFLGMDSDCSRPRCWHDPRRHAGPHRRYGQPLWCH